MVMGRNDQKLFRGELVKDLGVSTDRNTTTTTTMDSLDVEEESVLTAVFKDSFPGLYQLFYSN